MTVFFYTGGFTHNLHREAYAAPPPGTRFLPSTPALDGRIDAAELRRRSVGPFPQLGSRALALAAMERLGIPKVKTIDAPPCDVIHSAQDPLLTRRPWILDVEDVSAMFWYRRRILAKPWARAVVERVLGSQSCRAILPWTEAARRSLTAGLDCTRFASKIRTIYPCIAPRRRSTGAPAGRVKLLFIGSTFFTKGGIETLAAFSQLRARSVELVMISPAPRAIADSYSGDSRISIQSGVSAEELEHHYTTADIFILPVHTDTFGFVFLEAMAHGLPCLSTDHFAVPEIVRHERTGLVVAAENSYFDAEGLPKYDPVFSQEHPLVKRLQSPSSSYVDRLRTAMERLLDDAELRARLSECAFQEVTTGRFSQARHRSELQRISEEAGGIDDA